MKILNPILISMICLNIQPGFASAVNKTSPFETVQLENVAVTADLSTDKIKSLKDSEKIMPLEEIITQIKKDYPSRIIEIELEDEDGRYVYELELVDEKNVVWELEVDAASGEILKHEQDD